MGSLRSIPRRTDCAAANATCRHLSTHNARKWLNECPITRGPLAPAANPRATGMTGRGSVAAERSHARGATHVLRIACHWVRYFGEGAQCWAVQLGKVRATRRRAVAPACLPSHPLPPRTARAAAAYIRVSRAAAASRLAPA